MNKKWLWLIIGAVAVLGLFTGYTRTGDSETDPIVGTWLMYATSNSLKGPLVGGEPGHNPGHVTFCADGRFEAKIMDRFVGTWSRVGNGYKVVYSFGGKSYEKTSFSIYRGELYALVAPQGSPSVYVWYYKAGTSHRKATDAGLRERLGVWGIGK